MLVPSPLGSQHKKLDSIISRRSGRIDRLSIGFQNWGVQLQCEKFVEIIGKCGARILGEVTCHLLVELALENLFRLTAVHISWLAVRGVHRFEHHLKEGFPDEVLERVL